MENFINDLDLSISDGVLLNTPLLYKKRLKIEKKEILERIYVKYIYSEIKDLKQIETKLEKLEIKMLRKRYRNETRGLKILIEQEIELKGKKTKKNRR